jgi:TATA-box binding protein (TBP) (component of TFIID and TFIIIB)
MAFEFGEVDIRTMTCTCSVGRAIAESTADLETLSDTIEVMASGEGVRFVKSPGGRLRGETNPKAKPGSNAFGSQITMSVSVVEQDRNIHTKLFKNGTIQITGALTERAAYNAARIVSSVVGLTDDPVDMRIRMINSGLRCNRDLNRSALYAAMKHTGYCVFFDPCLYSGLKLSVFFDPRTNEPNGDHGNCRCQCFCGAKKPKKRWCKMVTASIFESGYIGITGATTVSQVHKTCEFLKTAIVCVGGDCAMPKYHNILKAIESMVV